MLSAFPAMPLKSVMKTVAVIGAVGSVVALHCSTTDHISAAGCASQGLFLDSTPRHADIIAPNISVLEDAFQALSVLQETYFDPNYGTWPEAIDWTAAVCETVLSGMLSTLTKSWELIRLDGQHEPQLKDNLISYYYEHIVNFYATQDQLAIRGEVCCYDL
jgi:hypothetical protein